MEMSEDLKTLPYDFKISFLMAPLGRMHREYLVNSEKLDNLTGGEIPYMMLLYFEGNKTQKEMADRFCFTESNAAKAIRKLEDKKLIERVVDDNNRRKKIVSLTEKGKTKCHDLIQLEDEWESIITEKYDEEEIKFIKESLYYMFTQSIKANESKFVKKDGE